MNRFIMILSRGLTYFLAMLPICLFGQVRGLPSENLSGISAKMNKLESTTAQLNFQYLKSDKFYNQVGNQEALYTTSDSVYVQSRLSVSLSYILTPNTEIGVELPLTEYASYIGTKHLIFKTNATFVALKLGLRLPFGLGYKDVYKNDKFGPAIGVALSHMFSHHTSVHLNLDYSSRYSSGLINLSLKNGLTASLDFKQSIHYQKVILLASLKRYNNMNADDRFGLLTSAIGLAYNNNHYSLLSVYYNKSLKGKSVLVENGLGLKSMLFF